MVAFLEKRIIAEEWWLPWLAAMTLVFLICNFPLVLGFAVGRWDVDGQYMQYFLLVADFARSGRLLCWDPWSNAGIPLMGDPQVGAFSPVALLFGLLTGGSTKGFIVYWLFMWWLGGLGIMALARHLHAPPWGGYLVAVGFLYCGAYTGHASHTSIVIALSFLPLIIWRLDVALSTGRLQPALEAGAIWGLSALSGYPGMTIISGCFCASWALGRYLTNPSTNLECKVAPHELTSEVRCHPSFGFIIVTLFVVCTVGSVVLLPTYFSYFYEGAGHHTRVGALSRDIAIGSNALHPGALATFASNFFPVLQMLNPNTLWTYTDVTMSSIYAGSVIMTFAVVGLLGNMGNRLNWWLALLALLSIGCALGNTLPLRGWLYDWVYPMRFFRHPGIFRAYYLFSVSILALLGTRNLADALERREGRLWSLLLRGSVFLAACAIAVYFCTYFSIPIGDGVEDVKAAVHLLIAWGGIVVVAFFGRVWGNTSKQGWIVVSLVMLATVDAFICAMLGNRTVVDFPFKQRWEDLDRVRSTNINLVGNGLRRDEMALNKHNPKVGVNNDQMITKVPVFLAYATEINHYHMMMAGEPALRKAAVGEERIWFTPKAMEASLSNTNFDAWAKRASHEGVLTLLVHAPEEMVRAHPVTETPNQSNNPHEISALPPLQSAQVKLTEYLPDALAFDVTCPRDGWLLVTDRWARSWKVEVNSKEETVYGGNFIFRAVKVSEGLNSIRFTYHPLGFPWLVAMSWSALAVIVILSGLSFLRKRQNQPR